MTKPVTIPNTFATATTAIPLSQLDSDFSTVATALNDANTYSNYAADTGVANAYVVTLTGVSTTYSAGLRIQFKAGNANTGASTLNVNGGGTKNITFQDASALSSGTIAANAIVDVMYDGTQFLLMNDPAGTVGTGDVVGPAGATANAIVRFDSTTGKLVKNSVVTIADSTGDMSGVGAFTATGNVTLGDATTDTITLTGTVQPGVVISGSSSGDALRITQTGAGNALLVEDAANPDSTPFVVTAAGDVGIGTSSPSNLLDVYKDSGTAYSSANVLSMGQWARISNPNTTSGTGVSLLFRANASSLAAVSCVSTAASNSAALTFAARQSDGTLAEQMRLDSSGNLGLGVTPSAWGSGTRAFQVGSGAALYDFGSSNVAFGSNVYFDGTNNRYINTDFATYYQQSNGIHYWTTAPSGTAGNAITFTQAMTLDADGYLLVGTTTRNTDTSIPVQINAGSNQLRGFSVNRENSYGISLGYNNITGNDWGELRIVGNKPMAFFTNNTERARITSGGYFKASDSGSYIDPALFHEFTQTVNSEALQVRATNASYTNTAFQIRASRNTTNTSFYYISCFNDGASDYRFRVADSGNCTNVNGSYGTISDVKMKTDIVDAGSQWADIKAVRFRKFKMKDDPSGLLQLGVVAQELEQTSPGLVDEHVDRDAEGNDLGTTTKSVKTSILLMKAAKALQEAMARIETLEAKVAALEGTQP